MVGDTRLRKLVEPDGKQGSNDAVAFPERAIDELIDPARQAPVMAQRAIAEHPQERAIVGGNLAFALGKRGIE